MSSHSAWVALRVQSANCRHKKPRAMAGSVWLLEERVLCHFDFLAALVAYACEAEG